MTELPHRFEYRDSKKLFAEGDLQGLMEALAHPDVRKSRLLRNKVVRELGDLADPQAAPALVQVLKADPDTGPRMYAAMSLGKIRSSIGLAALREALNDPDRDVRVWVIDSLGLLRDRESIEALISCLDDKEPWIRKNAAKALGQIGDHRATSSLIAHLDDHKARVGKAVASALVNLGDWNAIEPMREARARISPFRRHTVTRAVRELEDRFR